MRRRRRPDRRPAHSVRGKPPILAPHRCANRRPCRRHQKRAPERWPRLAWMSPILLRAPRSLLQAILDLVDPGAGAGVVQLAAGSAGGANRADRLVSQFARPAAAEKHHMRQLAERRDRIFALGPFGERERVAFERCGGIGLIESAIEGVRAGDVGTDCRDDHAVGIDHLRRLVITLFRAGRDRLARRFDRERRGYAMRRQRLRLRNRAHQRNGAERGKNSTIDHDAPPDPRPPTRAISARSERRMTTGAYESIFSAAMKASCGMSTLPNWRIFFLPAFCFSSSLRLRVASPP